MACTTAPVEEPEGPQLYLCLGLHVFCDVAQQVGQLLNPVGNPPGQVVLPLPGGSQG